MVVNKAFTLIFIEYSDFVDDFSSKLALALLKYIEINYHAIELIDERQLLYKSIYSLELVELETLKTYIKTNLVNSFIRPFKFPAKILIFFNKKLNKSL